MRWNAFPQVAAGLAGLILTVSTFAAVEQRAELVPGTETAPKRTEAVHAALPDGAVGTAPASDQAWALWAGGLGAVGFVVARRWPR